MRQKCCFVYEKDLDENVEEFVEKVLRRVDYSQPVILQSNNKLIEYSPFLTKEQLVVELIK